MGRPRPAGLRPCAWSAALLLLASLAAAQEKFTGRATAYTCERVAAMPPPASGCTLCPRILAPRGHRGPRPPRLHAQAAALGAPVAGCRAAPAHVPPPSGPRLAGPGEKNSQLAGGFNACQFGRLSPYFETYFAALPTVQFDRDSHCGRCAAAVTGTGDRATGKTVVVMIVDACATCSYGDLDFTTKVRSGGRGGAGRRGCREPTTCMRTPAGKCAAPPACPPCGFLSPHPRPPPPTPFHPFSPPQAANDITGYAFDSQPIEWTWVPCSTAVPPRVAYRDYAGASELVQKARGLGYNVNMEMMFADLTLTGGIIPYSRGPVAAANTAIALANGRKGAAAAAAAAARQKQVTAIAAAQDAQRKKAALAAAVARNATAPEGLKALEEAAAKAAAAAATAQQQAQAAVTAAAAAQRSAPPSRPPPKRRPRPMPHRPGWRPSGSASASSRPTQRCRRRHSAKRPLRLRRASRP